MAWGARLPKVAPRQDLRLESLADDVGLIHNAGGNVLVLATNDGVTLVDGGLAERSAELLKLVSREFGGRPVRNLFNTHWHWDHTGSNEALAQAGAQLYAQENTRLWLGTTIVSKWDQRTYPPRPARALPNHTFHYGSKVLAHGSGQLDYGYLPQAHTDGDLYVFSAQRNLLAAGDVVTGGEYPLVDYSTGGWLGGMIAGLKIILAKCDATTRVVPGRGPVRNRADVQAQLEMCQAVLGRVGESYYKGHTFNDFLAAQPTKEFDARWGDPALFLRTAWDGAWGHVGEIRRVNQ